jgi:hypothetical protein
LRQFDWPSLLHSIGRIPNSCLYRIFKHDLTASRKPWTMVHLLKSILTIGFGWSCPRVVVVTTTSTTAATLVQETMILAWKNCGIWRNRRCGKMFRCKSACKRHGCIYEKKDGERPLMKTVLYSVPPSRTTSCLSNSIKSNPLCDPNQTKLVVLKVILVSWDASGSRRRQRVSQSIACSSGK